MSFTQQNVPSPAIANSTVEYATSSFLIKAQALYKEDFKPELIGRFNDWDLGIKEILDEFGQTRAVKGNSYSHGEEDRNRYVVRVNAGYSTGAATTTFTISSSPDYEFDYPTSGQSIFPSSTTKYGINVRKGDKLEALVGTTRYFMWVTAAPTLQSGSTFPVELYDVTSTNAATTFAAGLDGVEIF